MFNPLLILPPCYRRLEIPLLSHKPFKGKKRISVR